ncbi:DUF4870 domain-containing protein [Glaciihabitans sp. UYNi722]|uniref:DUF4870 domain-containing protein n=1 Tax=Glaciihabitans sp. UYNi722 TaxID=3156344 RepID=UPI00339A736A
MSETTPPPANPYQTVQPLSPSDEKLWATLIHIGGIFLYFLPALIGYVLLKDRGPLVRDHTRTALNFQLTVLIGYLVGIFTSWLFVGFLIVLVVAVLNIIFSLMAAIAANRGEEYVCPIAIRFVSA